MARATKQAKQGQGIAVVGKPVECDGCGAKWTMPVAEYSNLIAERREFSCPNDCRRHFLAPHRSFATLQGAVTTLAAQVETAVRDLQVEIPTSPAVLEAAEEKLARALREIREIRASLGLR